jgi:hypothetical protein
MHFLAPVQPPLLSGAKTLYSHLKQRLVNGLHFKQPFLNFSHEADKQ